MAIGTDTIIEFFGTQDELTSTPATVASTAFSTLTDVPAWTNDDDAPQAMITLEGTSGAAVVAGKTIDLYVRKINVIDSTDDDIDIDANFKHEYLGSFPMAVGTAQRYTLVTYLPNFKTSSEFEFRIYNDSGQTLTSWKLSITPKTVGKHV